MKNHIINLLFFLSGISLHAQTNYAVAGIPKSLLLKSDAVVRRYELKFEVLNRGEAIETEHKVITLLHEKASEQNDQGFWYDQIQKIRDIEGAVYDANGKLVRKIKRSDITDRKAFEDIFVNDNRYKLLRFPRLSFPYTIEYTVVTKHNGLMHYPVFEPQTAESQAVEYAKFEILAADSLKVRYKEVNVLPGQQTAALRWEFRDLPAFDPEAFLPLGYTGLPRIISAPTLFSIEGYDGDMSSWDSFGQFIQKLNEGKNSLSAETEARLKKLTADCPDPICKARRVYELLQNSTRYYFVGMGIGGWQPMLASDVDKFKYSDCKGLSNYTVAMLRSVGVPAYYALIMATDEAQQYQTADFPNCWFNHATLCIPLPSDTIWLECTSQQQSFGYLSDFTDDRMALAIFPEGGRILHTPHYGLEENIIHRDVNLQLSADGSARLESNSSYRGIAQDIPAQLAEANETLRTKYLYKNIEINDFEILSLKFERKKERIPEVVETLSLKLPNLASVSGKRLFLPGKILSSKIELPMEKSPRQHPVQADSRGLTEEDNLSIALPAGYSLENEAPNLSFDSVFGHFELSVKAGSDSLQIHRKLVLNNSVQPKEQYEVLVGFLKNVAKADQMKYVLVRA